MIKMRIKNEQFRSFCAQPSHKHRNVTVFRHGAPEYCASSTCSHLDTLTEPSRTRFSVGVRKHIACPRDAVDVSDQRLPTQDKFCNRVCGLSSTIHLFVLRTLHSNATSSHMSK